MTLKCSHCGAPLKAEPDQRVVTCGYCHTATRISSTRQQPRADRSPGAPTNRFALFALAGVVITGAIAAFVALRARPAPPQQAAQPTQELHIEKTAHEATAPEETAPPSPQAEPTRPDAQPSEGAADPLSPPRERSKRTASSEPRYTGPISTKKDAEQILKPELLVCMKEHRVHYLITRLGNERRGGNVPPLGLTGTSVVDYKLTPGFASTPLGRCVARAASAVRAPAYGGDYIYFGLRSDSVPDPLADAAARLDTSAAKQALSALDDEARDCTTRSPAGSRPGESVRIMVFFQGATGEVSRVEPYYVETKSAYGRCLTSVYRKASVGKFREIEGKFLHLLTP